MIVLEGRAVVVPGVLDDHFLLALVLIIRIKAFLTFLLTTRCGSDDVCGLSGEGIRELRP